MSYINRNTLLDSKEIKTAEKLTWDIASILKGKSSLTKNEVSVAAYMVYKACEYEYPYSAVPATMNVDDEVKRMAMEFLSTETWMKLLALINSYEAKYFALVVLTANEDVQFGYDDTTPESIIKLANAILDIQDGESVADICCGKGGYLISTAMTNPKAMYTGVEINKEYAAIAKMKADILEAYIEVIADDAFNLFNVAGEPNFDKVFSNYPFGLKLKMFDGAMSYFRSMSEQYPEISKATSSDWVYNALLVDILSETGKAVGIMTNGSTVNSIDMPMRRYFIENNWIESVITLPGKMFASTNMQTSLIVLNKNKITNDIRLVDASELYQKGRRQNEFSDENISAIKDALEKDCKYSKTVTFEELKANDYVLSWGRYQDNKRNIENGVPFETVIKNVSRGAQLKASELDEMVAHEETDMQYLMLANIKNGLIDENLPYLATMDSKYAKYCLKNNNLILSKNGYPYKVAIAKVEEGKRILANGNLYVIELDEEKVNPYFVKAFLESEQGVEGLKLITVGATIPNIGVEQLKKMPIPLPSMEEQNRIAEKYLATLDEIKQLETQLDAAKNKLKSIYDGAL